MDLLITVESEDPDAAQVQRQVMNIRKLLAGNEEIKLQESPEKNSLQSNGEETSEKLLNLPDEAKFPEDLKEKICYDASRQLLIFKGVMSSDDRDKLLSLSEDDAYRNTVEKLFFGSREERRAVDPVSLTTLAIAFLTGGAATALINVLGISHPGARSGGVKYKIQVDKERCLEFDGSRLTSGQVEQLVGEFNEFVKPVLSRKD